MSTDLEKVDDCTIEDIKFPSETPDRSDRDAEKRLLRKCDLHVVPILTLLFMFAFLDRINIGNARLMGLEDDLGMSGHQYNIALFVFFIPYILFEVPSNMILKKVKPSWWLSGIMFAWGSLISLTLHSSLVLNGLRALPERFNADFRFKGTITICQGVTASFTGLVVCRVLIGLFESGFMPGAVYLINMYYRRHELQWRLNLFFSASIIAGAVSGLLAYAINNMSGVAGYEGWRWIFIIEGLATVVIAAISKFLIVDWPESAKFLNDDERALLLARLKEDQGEARMNRLDKKSMRRTFSDPKIYLGPIMYFGIVNTGYAVSFFTPTILHQLGWTAVRAQVMSIPVYVVATITTLSAALLSDLLRHRYLFTLAGCLIATMGYVILLAQSTVPVGARYFAIFAVTSGGYLTQPILMGWLSNNMAGHYKQSIASAMQIGFGNCGGLVASNIFFEEEAPGYRTGYGVSLGMTWICGIACVLFLGYLIRENRVRGRGGRDYRYQLPREELENLGDDYPAFTFTY
ncbi:major facilitator superfamily domain-containing protein [Aspergillus caelatus]|uniref:Major facilitator superfamily domain-containing protein n=2 Tax=Aspergillus subgen. Circumdati TaxID=2720871 RepID=A0A5N7AEY1_9EURO|nr:major facilitator superfamily domain-containing protein [Aspergillus caelatus]KAE8368275.1 major facilitator superfamily domain-containing protein [Aspergillus caelatus]KAE8413303.1 major facilitator superfamily domain-containing protein [Aspergillus pseudocaelatus]